MRNIVLPILILLFAACGEEEKTENIVPVSEEVELINIEEVSSGSKYIYIITNIKTGEVKELSQQEYLSSDYIDNPDFTVKEKVIVE